MRESEDLCEHIGSRLRFLQTALPHARASIDPDEYTKIVARYALVVVSAIDFIKHYSSKRGPQRVAARRAVRKAVHRVHSEIDAVFIDAGFGSAPEMTEWKDEEEDAIDAQHARLSELVSNLATLVNGLINEELHEALAEIQLELTRRPNPQRFKMVLELARTAVAEPLGIDLTNYSIPEWFVSRDDVKIDEQIDIGAFGAVHRAEWGVARVVVCGKLLLVDGAEAQQQLLAEANMWTVLRHPNVVRMLGACHVGKPLFFISELARSGILVDYLDNTPKNKQKIWQYFLDAAQGLSYLHENEIVHADIKCNNILIANDGNAQLCDFGFSHTRTLSIGKSVKVQAMAVRWKAPECVLNVGVYANPRFESDVYSLGMSIIEAKTGHVPWGLMVDDDINTELASGTGYPRPADVFTDDEWDLVKGMTMHNFTQRMPLTRAIETMRRLAEEEKRKHGDVQEPEDTPTECPSCGNANQSTNKFCSECGKQLEEVINQHISLPMHQHMHFALAGRAVLEDAEHGSLLEYVRREAPIPMDRSAIVWRILHQAALGLAHLHDQGVVHGHLRCSNILVTSDGTVKLSDFGFDAVRSEVGAMRATDRLRALQWSAPELLLNVGGQPTRNSDVYAFGMCIIEAMTGQVPWSGVDEDNIPEQLESKIFHLRPAGVFSDKEWKLVTRLSAIDKVERIELSAAIAILKELADGEVRADETKAAPPAIVQLNIATYHLNVLVVGKCDTLIV